MSGLEVTSGPRVTNDTSTCCLLIESIECSVHAIALVPLTLSPRSPLIWVCGQCSDLNDRSFRAKDVECFFQRHQLPLAVFLCFALATHCALSWHRTHHRSRHAVHPLLAESSGSGAAAPGHSGISMRAAGALVAALWCGQLLLATAQDATCATGVLSQVRRASWRRAGREGSATLCMTRLIRSTLKKPCVAAAHTPPLPHAGWHRVLPSVVWGCMRPE
jgi:hypothetical protein